MVGVREIDAEREAAGEAGDFNFGMLLVEGFLEEESGRFAFDGGVGGDDNFLNGVGFDPSDEFADMELVRHDAVDGRNRAAEDVIGAMILFCLLDGVDVERLFDDENGGFVAFRIVIERRDFLAGVDEREGDGAGLYAVVETGESNRDILTDAWAVFEQKISIAFGGTCADAGKMAESFDSVLESLW